MTLVIHTFEQGSEEWHRARCGIVTASMFKTILGIKKDAADKKTRQTYMRQLAGEIITGEPAETYSNAHMERGKVMEAQARAEYAFDANVDLVQVGFIQNGPKGCSPDSLIGANGLLEIKTALPPIVIEKILKDDFPPEHKAQCQGALWVAEREFVDISIFWPKMPRFVKRAYRDEIYIAELAEGVEAFNTELADMVSTVRRYGMKEAA